MLIIYPINLGKHNNIHFIIRNKERTILFHVVAFYETSTAYIVKNKNKINEGLLNNTLIYNLISDLLNDKGFLLKTPLHDLFKQYDNTTDIIINYDLNIN